MGSLCFNPRTPCGVRLNPGCRMTNCYLVSIHALLAECDHHTPTPKAAPAGFNPRTPCGVRHLWRYAYFLKRCFNPRTPCGVRPRPRDIVNFWISFNPRTPCGVRPLGNNHQRQMAEFQSTHSLRSATIIRRRLKRHQLVSIHALLAECDPSEIIISGKWQSFNPRTPCGVRPARVSRRGRKRMFQSTHSLRSATYAALTY